MGGGVGGAPVAFDLLSLVANAGVTEASGAITDWADQSASGVDFSQTTASRQPTLQTRDTVPVVRFDGTDFLESAAVAFVPEYSIWLHTYLISATSNGRLFTTRSGNTGISQHSTTGEVKLIYNAANSSSTGDAVGAWHTYCVTVSGTASSSTATFYEDGVVIATLPPRAVPVDAKALYVASQASGGAASNIDVAEIGVKSGVLSSADIAALETYATEQRAA